MKDEMSFTFLRHLFSIKKLSDFFYAIAYDGETIGDDVDYHITSHYKLLQQLSDVTSINERSMCKRKQQWSFLISAYRLKGEIKLITWLVAKLVAKRHRMVFNEK